VRAPVLLLPPSEGKATGGSGAWRPGSGAFAELGGPRQDVADALAAVQTAHAGSLFGIGGHHLERALEANRSLLGAPTLRAAERYTGVVHTSAGLAGLPARLANRVVLLSGLLGAVALGDPVPDYRVKMGASVAPLGRLSTWWRPRLEPVLGERCRGRVVVDLLPNEHLAAFDPVPVAARVLRARFEKGGRVIGHDAKVAKGLLARHLLTAGNDPIAAAAEFEADGWTFDAAASDLEARVATAVYVR
jgi:cytoplasmic iron level regulating protein YaaA (DUF328/UPF0246 family)